MQTVITLHGLCFLLPYPVFVLGPSLQSHQDLPHPHIPAINLIFTSVFSTYFTLIHVIFILINSNSSIQWLLGIFLSDLNHSFPNPSPLSLLFPASSPQHYSFNQSPCMPHLSVIFPYLLYSVTARRSDMMLVFVTRARGDRQLSPPARPVSASCHHLRGHGGLPSRAHQTRHQ